MRSIAAVAYGIRGRPISNKHKTTMSMRMPKYFCLKMDIMGIDEITLPGRSTGSTEWQAPEEAM